MNPLTAAWTKTKELYFMWITSTVLNRENLQLGSGSHWAAGCWFNCYGGLSIGNNVIIGPNVAILTSNHNYHDTTCLIKDQGSTCKPVQIDDDTWIGANVTVLPGVHVGKGCVVGAGAVVTHNIPDGCVAVGNPARVVKVRGEPEVKFEDVMFQLIREPSAEYIPNPKYQPDKKAKVKIPLS